MTKIVINQLLPGGDVEVQLNGRPPKTMNLDRMLEFLLEEFELDDLEVVMK